MCVSCIDYCPTNPIFAFRRPRKNTVRILRYTRYVSIPSTIRLSDTNLGTEYHESEMQCIGLHAKGVFHLSTVIQLKLDQCIDSFHKHRQSATPRPMTAQKRPTPRSNKQTPQPIHRPILFAILRCILPIVRAWWCRDQKAVEVVSRGRRRFSSRRGTCDSLLWSTDCWLRALSRSS